jgi:hypothetical protein
VTRTCFLRPGGTTVARRQSVSRSTTSSCSVKRQTALAPAGGRRTARRRRIECPGAGAALVSRPSFNGGDGGTSAQYCSHSARFLLATPPKSLKTARVRRALSPPARGPPHRRAPPRAFLWMQIPGGGLVAPWVGRRRGGLGALQPQVPSCGGAGARLRCCCCVADVCTDHRRAPSPSHSRQPVRFAPGIGERASLDRMGAGGRRFSVLWTGGCATCWC